MELNANLNQRIYLQTAQMPWQSSPSPTVWRKRLSLSGPEEAGAVTSIVRYDRGSRFHSHEHPDGEEILVLEGTFSDEHGDWPAGTYLLNPEGFEHAPFSREGCVLFVKLRQYPGRERPQLSLRTEPLPWEPFAPGVAIKRLFEDPRFPDSMRLERWSAGAIIDRPAPGGLELLVLGGYFEDRSGSHPTGTWARLPRGAVLSASTSEGCELFVKIGHL